MKLKDITVKQLVAVVVVLAVLVVGGLVYNNHRQSEERKHKSDAQSDLCREYYANQYIDDEGLDPAIFGC